MIESHEVSMMMMMLFWFFGLAIVLAVAWFAWTQVQNRPMRGREEDADEILKRRYARGEIDEATYERMRTELHDGTANRDDLDRWTRTTRPQSSA